MANFNFKILCSLSALLCVISLNAPNSAFTQNISNHDETNYHKLFYSNNRTILTQGTMSLNEYFPFVIDNEIKAEWGSPIFKDNFLFFNTNYWEIRPSTNDIEYATSANVQSLNDQLVIKCKKENKYVVSDKKFYYITTGNIWTKGSLNGGLFGNNNDGKFQYGYFEALVQWSRGKGMHPCFWLFGNSNGEGHEIDICEPSHYGLLPGDALATAEKGNGSTGNQHIAHYGTNVHRFVNDQDISFPHHFGIPNQNIGLLSDTFNKYAVEWTPHEITWYFNDREIRRLKKTELIEKFGIQTLHPMRLILGTGYDNRLDQDSPSESQLIAKYIRVYQKKFYKEKPNIKYFQIECEPQINVCNTLNNMQFTASNYQSSDLLKWEIIDDNGYIIGSSTNNEVMVAFYPQKRTMTLKLTTTDTQANSSSRTLVITNRLDSYFFIDKYSCSNGVSSLKVIANNAYKEYPNVGSEWALATCDVDGNIIEDGIETGWGKESYTFHNLESNRYYRIFHGVWKNGCSDWSQASRVYHTSYLRSFDMEIIRINNLPSKGIGNPNEINANKQEKYNIKLKAHHNTDPSVYHQWYAYQSDSLGVCGAQIGTVQTADSVVITNLICDNYYLIKHGIWSQCNEWKESSRLVYVPKISAKRKTISHEIEFISPMQSPSLNIYPNPVSEKLTINSDTEIENVYIFDFTGQLMMHHKNNNYTITIDCNSFLPGEYLFMIMGKDFTETKKVIIL